MTDRLDLPRRYREELEALLRKHVPDAKVWAHGSRVNDRSHDGSDLDLSRRLHGLGGDIRRPFPIDVMFPQLRRQLFADGAAPAYVDRCTVAVGIFSQFLEMRDSLVPGEGCH